MIQETSLSGRLQDLELKELVASFESKDPPDLKQTHFINLFLADLGNVLSLPKVRAAYDHRELGGVAAIAHPGEKTSFVVREVGSTVENLDELTFLALVGLRMLFQYSKLSSPFMGNKAISKAKVLLSKTEQVPVGAIPYRDNLRGTLQLIAFAGLAAFDDEAAIIATLVRGSFLTKEQAFSLAENSSIPNPRYRQLFTGITGQIK